MQLEFDSLLQNEHPNLFLYLDMERLLTKKWFFQTKLRIDRSFDKYKSRVVTNFFQQIKVIDYTKASNSIVKPTNIIKVLPLAMSNGWKVQKIDFNTACFNGDQNEVYLAQLEGFVNEQFLHYACKLRKEIYGLKKTLRAWFLKINGRFQSIGLNSSCSYDALPYEWWHYNFFIYVDDILVIEKKNTQLIKEIITKLNSAFSIKELGELG